MTPTEHPKFLEVLAGVHDFYGKDLSKFAGQVWLEAVKGYELQQVTKALSAHLADPERGQFMPKPADVVRQLQGTQTDRALTAWGKAAEAASRIGAYTDVVFDDPIIHLCVVDIGGWVKLCRTDFEELSYLQHRFCECYRAYVRRGIPTDYPARLSGAGSGIDEYAKRGLTPPAPALVGDKQAAKLVLAGGVANRIAVRSVSELLAIPAKEGDVA